MTEYVLLGVLLAFSALFSGAETALFSLERQRLAAWAVSPNPLRRLAERLVAEPRNLLLTLLLGNLLVNVTFYAVASTLAIEAARHGRDLRAAAFGIGAPAVIIFFGDITPKVVALGFTGFLAAATAPLIWGLKKVLWPLRVTLGAVASPFSAAFVDRRRRTPRVTAEELKMLVDESQERGIIERHESILMRELIDFSRVTVREVMVPRVDMAVFHRGRPVEELHDLIRSTRHSRVPVYGSSPDDILGILDAREALLNPDKPVDEMLQKPWFVPETKTVESLLAEFRRQKRTTAVVVDEYGGTAGLVTLEDVVEALVGDIHDEYDRPEPLTRACGENCWLLPGRTSVADWAEMFGTSVEDRRPATLGGFVLMLLGHLPKEGEQVTWGGVRFTIMRVRRRSIEEVLVEYVGGVPPEGRAAPSGPAEPLDEEMP